MLVEGVCLSGAGILMFLKWFFVRSNMIWL